jgi:hypothetical protein
MNPVAQAFLFALGSYGLAGLLFFIFHGMEHSGSGATVHWFIALLYTLGGKWLVAGVFGFLGTFFLVCGFILLFTPRKK